MLQLKMAKDQNRLPHTHTQGTHNICLISLTFKGKQIKTTRRGWLAAQVERCMSLKHEVLSLDPQHPHKSQVWSPGLEWQGRGSLDFLATQCSQLIQWETLSQKWGGEQSRKRSDLSIMRAHTWTCTCVHTHERVQTQTAQRDCFTFASVIVVAGGKWPSTLCWWEYQVVLWKVSPAAPQNIHLTVWSSHSTSLIHPEERKLRVHLKAQSEHSWQLRVGATLVSSC